MANTRALKLKENGAEFETKLSDIRRLKKALQTYLNENFYVERMNSVTFSRTLGRHPDRGDVNVKLYAAASGASFTLFSGQFSVDADAQFDLKLVRIVHENMDALIELAEELSTTIHRLDSFKQFLGRFGVE
jgi:hypothetical protein